LLYLTAISPAIAWVVARLAKEMALFRWWWLAVWLALITHPLLDVMTVYGTQLWLPLTNYPYGVGSIFIIDPLYTVPLLVGVVVALVRRDALGFRWNNIGLLLSTVYLAWSVAVQQYVTHFAKTSLHNTGVSVRQLLVTPTPLNTLIWRVLAIGPRGYAEGFYSMLDDDPRIDFTWHPRDDSLYEEWSEDPNVARIARFSHGFFKMEERGDQVQISDLRMGQEPYYTFTFVVGERQGDSWVPVSPRMVSQRPDAKTALRWLWQRARGKPVPKL
jgi:inner membrane protein